MKLTIEFILLLVGMYMILAIWHGGTILIGNCEDDLFLRWKISPLKKVFKEAIKNNVPTQVEEKALYGCPTENN